MSRPDDVWPFALRTLAWLGPSFALWYWISPWHARPVAWFAARAVNLYTNGVVSGLEFQAAIVTFISRLQVQSASGQAGLLTPEVNALVYTYGMAMLAALLLASRASIGKHLLGIAALLPFQAWGLAFEVIVELGVKTTPEIAAQAGIVGWKREAAALGYQMGSLIFPALAPVVAWAVMQRAFIERLARKDPAPP